MIRVLVLGFLITGAFATEPLLDRLVTLEGNGDFYPEECCWVGIPNNEKVREIIELEEGCSAVGGPVGVFRREGNTLYLTELNSCSGKYSLSEIYGVPEGELIAAWVSGIYIGKFNYLCEKPNGQYVFERISIYVIEQGLFKSTNTSFHDRNECEYD